MSRIQHSLDILQHTTLKEWQNMPCSKFITDVVEDLNMMPANQFCKLIARITYPQFEMFIKKCWEEQDTSPQDTNDEELFRQAYDETLPIVVLLENALTTRIQTEESSQHKQKMGQQLALVNIILSPHLFDGIANQINT